METFTLKSVKKLIGQFDQIELHPQIMEPIPDLLKKAEKRLSRSSTSQSRQLKQALCELENRKVSYLYRIEHQFQIEVHHSIDFLKHELMKKMVDWVYDYPGFNPDTHDRFPERKINEVCEQYPAYASLLLRDARLLLDFFKWSIRDNNEVAPFVLFPKQLEMLRNSNLAQRTGYNQGKDLEIRTSYDSEGHMIRTLWLPVEGEHVNAAKWKDKIAISDGSERTLEEIFAVFENKNHHPGDLEYFPRIGITYWPSYEPWKVMDVGSDKFWHEGPQLRILSIAEAKRLYGNTVPGLKMEERIVPVESLIERDGMYWIEHDRSLLNEVKPLEFHGSLVKVRMRERVPIDGRNFLKVVRASKQADMSFLKTHGFGDVLIPLESGRYYLFSCGKYPKVYPESTFRLISEFVRVVLATLQIVDDNVFFNHRNHTHECIGLTPKEGHILLEIIRLLMVLARDDKLGFEFQAEGCAKMEQVDVVKLLMYLTETFDEIDDREVKQKVAEVLYSKELDRYDLHHLPNFFRTTLDYVNPEGGLGVVFSLIKKCFLWLQPYLVSLVFLSIGAWRGMTFQIGGRSIRLSHTTSSCWHDQSYYRHSIYHPGWLHYQQEAKGITLLKRKLDLVKLPFYKD